MAYTANYNTSSGASPVKTNPVPITINGKTIPGYQTTFSDGTSKWIYEGDTSLSSNFDYSSLTGLKDSNGNWTWQGTTPNSIPNLGSRTGLTVSQINTELYAKPQLQTALNGSRILQLGGIPEAQKVDSSIPGTLGTSSNPNEPIQQGGASPTYTQEEIGNTTSLSSGINTPLTIERIIQILGEKIVYPTKLTENGQDYINFTMIEYGQRPFQLPTGSNTTSFKIGTRDLKTRGTSVYLPIQPSINDQNDIGWGEDNMNVFKAVLANIATTGSGAVLGSELDKVGELFGGNSEYGKVLRRYLGGQAVGINPLSRTDGLVLNPNLELLFSGPSLRPFNFTFRLSPRNQTEADNVKKIIKFFKIASTVRTTNDGLFLKAPYVFDIAYRNQKILDDKTGKTLTTEHQGLNKIKTCALRTISVNYTPDGSYMTFEDGTMTSYEISLQFCELEPVYDSDYARDNNINHAIGY